MTFWEDDIDGSGATETVMFAVDGISYEIDLNDSHATEMRAAFRPYTDAGRKRQPAGPGHAQHGQIHAARLPTSGAWAKDQGPAVNDR